MHDRFAAFALHDWHKDNDAAARFPIGGSGVPPANLAPYLPDTDDGRQALSSTSPTDAIAGVKDRLRGAYGFAADEVLLTQGASEADFLAAFALVASGFHVVVEQPAYFALLEPARALGADVTRVPRRAEDGFALDVEAVADAITARTRLVALARPNNPTGHRVPDGDLRRIAEAAEDVDAYVLVDEVFAEATTAGDTPARRLHDRILSVNSITKCLGFGSMQVGWIAGPTDVVGRLERAKEHVRPLNPTLTLRVAERILADRGRILAATRARRAENASTVAAFIHGQDRLAWLPPEHGTTAVFRLPGDQPDDVAFAKRLLDDAGVLVSPGSFVELPGWVRVGLLTEPDVLREGLARLGRAAQVEAPAKR